MKIRAIVRVRFRLGNLSKITDQVSRLLGVSEEFHYNPIRRPNKCRQIFRYIVVLKRS